MGLASHKAYQQVDIETASQGKLVVMLFNGAIRRADEAKAAIEASDPVAAHNHLIRAQDIIAELRSALDISAGDVAQNLDRIYEFFHYSLVQANLQKSTGPIDDCLELMTEVRDMWEEAFAIADAEPASNQPAPQANRFGEAAMNLSG